VVSDDEMGMRLAVDHLAGVGHKQIAHVGGPLTTSTGTLRRKGFLNAMAHHGLNGTTPARFKRVMKQPVFQR
jgi:LacI family transcriptional regulator